MSEKFNDVKKYYDVQLWTEEKVVNAVKKGWITAEEFKSIVGKEYTA